MGRRTTKKTAMRNNVSEPCRGEIWQVDLEPIRGSETGKARPVLVISDERLGRLPTRLVVPITGWRSVYGDYVWMTRLEPTPGNGLSKTSAADALQARVASLERFVVRLGILPADDVAEIAASLGLCIRLIGAEDA